MLTKLKHMCDICTGRNRGCKQECLDDCLRLGNILVKSTNRDTADTEPIDRPHDLIRVARKLAENYGQPVGEIISMLENGTQLRTVGFLYERE